MHQVRFEGQGDNSDGFVIVNAVSENSEQYDLNLSSSADNLNNSLTPAQNTQALKRTTTVKQGKQPVNSMYKQCITVSVSQPVVLSADQRCVALQDQLQVQAMKLKRVYSLHKF